MEAPSAEQIRTWSKLDWDDLEYGKPPTGEDPLDVIVTRAIDYVQNATGQKLAEMPEEFISTAQEAIQRRAEQLAIKSQEDEAETAGDIDMISSFSAGNYSEQRINAERSTKFAPHFVNPWPLLNDLLLRMMTVEKLEWWREQWGETVPAMEITEVDWAAGDYVPAPTDELWGA